MPNKLIWTEGAYVWQHHFQQQDRYHESLLRERLQAITHYDWGVRALEVEARGLASGQLKIQLFSGIWPDGTSVHCGDGTGEPAPPPRSFESAFTADAPKLEVFLGLPTESEGSPAVGGDDSAGAARRYVTETRSVTDYNTGTSAVELEFARPNLRLFFGSERQDGFATIRIAEIVRQSNGQPIIRDNYVPPVLYVSAAPFLVSGLQRVFSGITSRQRELAGERKQRQSGNVEFHATDARKFWLLHTLNGAVPELSHLIETRRVHPEEVYSALSRLAGQLTTFAPTADPTSLPKFNYLELGDVFEELFARIVSLLGGGIEQTYVEIGLEHRQDGMFIGKLADKRLSDHEMFVAVQSNMAEAMIRERVPAVLKMASWNQIYDVVKQARHGVRMEIDWNPTAALPLKPGVCFFRVRREGPFWNEIVQSSTIALYLPVDADWNATTLSLYAVDPAHMR
jgi:type VI secretion system protein ImpJ